jgi:serine/threonine protein kinase
MSIRARLNHILAGKYRIDAFVGAGGMGLVYAASHRVTEQSVAVKFLRRELADQPELTRRFLKEAQIVARLHHPNAVKLMELGDDPDYGPYMVLELLRGESLETQLSRVHSLTLEQACAWLLPIMDMLEHAHAHAVLHRDIKPANIFLHEAGPGRIVPKLLDFGLGRVMNEQLGLGTKTGQMLGTPAHMSPEQASGAKGLKAASDVWSMATVWYRCLSGREAFERGTADATLVAVVNGEYKRLVTVCPQLPRARALSKVLDKALCVDPNARTQSIATLRAQLADIAARDNARWRRSGVRRIRPAAPRWLLAVAGVLLLLLAAAACWWVSGSARGVFLPRPHSAARP